MRSSAAFGWMARERVAVINVSLVGPRNKLMERVVKTLVSRGHLIVAAVGNDGPAAPPLYPASYDGVIGVTAVDEKHRVLIEACRGKQVDFAAQGADIAGRRRRAEHLRAGARHFVRGADHRDDVRRGSRSARSGAGAGRAREVEGHRATISASPGATTSTAKANWATPATRCWRLLLNRVS